MDNVYVRTATDLERKYNLSKLAKDSANIETMNNEIIHLNNQLEETKKSIIINLGDTLQESVSLWFYEGTPTTTNEPYIDWLNPSEHIDDLYYDQLTGYVYKYTSNGWVQQYDTNLINALALTNAELDVSNDRERKVYLTQPTPPYSSGDWWILEDGTLMICQLGKPLGETYEENDFIVSSKYTSTIASKENDTIKVISGSVTEIQRGNESITQTIAEYKTLIDGNGEAIGTLTNSFTSYQDTTTQQFQAITGTLENGVEKLKNTLVKIDANGINTSSGESFNTQITDRTFEVKDGTNELAFLGFDNSLRKTVARIPELESRKITVGLHRTEIIEEDNDKWTAEYYVGDGS